MAIEGLSLDLRIIGLGQAGGNLAAEFAQRGYPALAFNTARTDLSALGPSSVGPGLQDSARVYIGIAGYDGAGADPDYGRSCIAEHAELILSKSREHVAGADVIVVAAGLGGGTGSSVRALIQVLSELSLPIVCLVTLPTENESGIVKVNAVRAINELLEHDLEGWIIVDNASLATTNRDLPARQYYAQINQQIIEPIDALNRLNDRGSVHAIRSFDGEDFRKVLLAGGLIHLNHMEVAQSALQTEAVVSSLLEGWQSSDLMPDGVNVPSISNVALIIEASESTLSNTPMHVLDQMTEELKSITEGAAIDLGLYQSTGPDVPTSIRVISVSRGLPERILDVVNSARDEGRVLSDKMHERLPSLELGDIDELNLFGKRAKRRPSSQISGATNLKQVARNLPSSSARPSAQPTSLRAASQSSPSPSPSQPPQAAASTSRPPASYSVKPPASSASSSSQPPVSIPPPLPPKQDPTSSSASSAGAAQASDDKALGAQAKSSEKSTPKKTKKDSKKNGDAVPNAEVYDDLVENFRKNQDETVRSKIAGQLEDDFDSEHAVVRFYAVDAMAKLDRKRFETILLAATEDESAAVRKIAKAALQR